MPRVVLHQEPEGGTLQGNRDGEGEETGMNDRQGEPSSRRVGRRAAAIGAATALLTALGVTALGDSTEAKPRKKGKNRNNRNTNTAVSTGQGGPGGTGGGGGTVVVTCPPVC